MSMSYTVLPFLHVSRISKKVCLFGLKGVGFSAEHICDEEIHKWYGLYTADAYNPIFSGLAETGSKFCWATKI
jgi:hypothetical protein